MVGQGGLIVKKLLVLGVLLVALLPSRPDKSTSKLYFLGVAVNYTERTNDTYARDAIHIGSTLLKNNSFADYEEKFLLGKNATKSNILEQLKYIANTVGEEDVAIVYIGAHGSTLKSKYYFCPYDYMPNNPIWGHEIKNTLEKIKGTLILILDTCHSGGILNEWNGSENILIICACQESECSNGRHFQNILLEAMQHSDTNNDAYISVQEIIDYLVPRTTFDELPQHMRKSSLFKYGSMALLFAS